jgi:ectoine hydroxylase-related dioxygenase (phytanoyl-CoA dioxygenase family)
VNLPHVGSDTTVDEVLDALTDAGAVVVERHLDDDDVTQISEELSQWYDSALPGGAVDKHPFMANFYGRQTRRFTGLAAKSSRFVEKILLDPLVLEAANRTLLRFCEGLQLNTAQAMIVGPTETAQFLHRDQENWLPYRPPAGHEIVVSSMWAISDFTEHNGATRVVPGSHRWAPERQPEPAEITSAAMPKGSVLLYLGSTVHGAGSNQTEASRFGLHVSFLAGWLRPEENHFLTVNPSTAQDLPQQAKALLGYESYGEVARLGLVDFDPVGPRSDDAQPA